MGNIQEKISSKMPWNDERSILPDSWSGGPHGIGDPDDRSLLIREKTLIIPRKAAEKARKTVCAELVKEFNACTHRAKFLSFYKCSKERDAMAFCILKCTEDALFVKRVTEEYLKERSEYRRTGLTKRTKNVYKIHEQLRRADELEQFVKENQDVLERARQERSGSATGSAES